MSWFSLHSWRLFSWGIAIWVDSSFLSAPEKCPTSFWAPWKIYCHSNCFCPIWYPVCIDAFLIFPLSLVFRILINLEWISLGLPWLRFTQLLKLVGLFLLPNLVNILPLFLLAIFQHHLSLSPSRLRVMNVRSSVILPQTSEFLFFSLFSLCCSNWVISIVLSPSSLILPSVTELIGCHVTLLLSHPLSF